MRAGAMVSVARWVWVIYQVRVPKLFKMTHHTLYIIL